MGKIELYEVESLEQSTVDVVELDWLRATNYIWFINMDLTRGGLRQEKIASSSSHAPGSVPGLK